MYPFSKNTVIISAAVALFYYISSILFAATAHTSDNWVLSIHLSEACIAQIWATLLVGVICCAASEYAFRQVSE